MRMDDLLGDLEARLAADALAEMRAEAAEGARAERASVELVDRLRADVGRVLSVAVPDLVVHGTLVVLGSGWLALDRRGETPRRLIDAGVQALVRPGVSVVALDTVESVTGLSGRYRQEEVSAVGLTWGSLLRACGRARTTVAWRTRSGAGHTGAVSAVGADHVVLQRSGGSPVTLTTSGLAVLDPVGGRPESLRQ